MVWGAIGFNGKTDLVIFSGKQKSVDYQQRIWPQLFTYGEKIGSPNLIFQQDGCSIHKSNSTMDFLASKNVRLFDWPSLSPDFNIIENVWGEMTRRVYSNGKQYPKVSDLRAAIFEAWEAIDLEYLQNLFKSMKHRIHDVIANKGGPSGR